MSKSGVSTTNETFITTKIALLGDGAVGKTSIKEKYLGRGFQERYMPTLGADIRYKEITIQNTLIRLHIWDLAGQPKFNKIRTAYYRGTRIAILVYDITNPLSLQNLKEWIKELHKNNRRKNIPLIIVGNKIDLRPTVKNGLTTELGQKFVENLKIQLGDVIPIHFFESSAKTGHNVNEIFQKVGEEILGIINPQKD